MSADEIVTSLYRRFKDWSNKGFTADDVTWCEVRADVISLIGIKEALASQIAGLAVENEKLESENAALKQQLADYEEVLQDKHRLTRELDVLLNGNEAARQASLCDLVGQLGLYGPAILKRMNEAERMPAPADAIMSFVNTIIEAYEAGFTPYPHCTLQQLHRIAQHHVLDNYQIESKGFSELWGQQLFDECRAISEKWDQENEGKGF